MSKRRKRIKIAGFIAIGFLIAIMIFCICVDVRHIGKYPDNETGVTLCINEVMYANLGMILDSDGDNSDWIEIYNYGKEAIDLSGYSISDHSGKSKRWFFPKSSIDAGEYMILWASGKDKVTSDGEIHTDFMIGDSETITLFDRDGNVIDKLFVNENVDPGVSVGRLYKEPDSFALLSNISPGEENNAQPISYVTKTDSSLSAPVLSRKTGVYDEEFELSITVEDDSAVILYTLDGSDPTASSLVYKKPIKITDRTGENSTIAGVKTTPNYEMNYRWENSYTYKGTVVKARTMKNGVLSDKIVTGSYFISPDTDFNIVSLTVDADKLFDKWDGLYVPGSTYYIWKKYNKESKNNVYPPANYDSDNKVRGYVEILDNSGKVISDGNVELGIMGAASRSLPAKSLELDMADNKKAFDPGIFTLLPEDSTCTDEGLDEIVLRPSGTDFNRTMFCDILSQSIVADKMNVTYIGAQNAVLFINGEYWGIHNIRESYDEDYFYRHYGIEPKNLTLIKLNTDVSPYAPEVSNGDLSELQDYYELVKYVQSHDLSDDDNYEYVKSQVDIDSLIDYYIAEMYFGNDDWPGNNFRIWRADQEENDYGDNKWRFILYDIDDGFLYPEFDTIEYILNEDYDKKAIEGINLNYDANRELICALIKNEEFGNAFFDRFEECLNTVFATDNVIDYIDSFEDIYSSEMDDHFLRWHTTDGWLKRIKNMVKYTYSEKDLYTYEKWEEKVDKMRLFAEERPDNLRTFIYNYRNE